MKPLPAVERFDVFKDHGSSFFPGLKASLFAKLRFQAFEEALHHRVVVAIAFTAHAWSDVVLLEHLSKRCACVLAALVRMMCKPDVVPRGEVNPGREPRVLFFTQIEQGNSGGRGV